MAVLTFMTEALKSFRQIGTFLPAQAVVIKTVANAIPRRPNLNIVELGAGEGCITRGIIRKMDGLPYRLAVFELNEVLMNAGLRALGLPAGKPEARINQGRITFLRQDAFAFADILAGQGMGELDVVISALPLSHCSRGQREQLLRSITRVLRDQGVYIQYRHTPRGLRELRSHFEDVRRQFALNVLPAWIYTCKAAVRVGGGNGDGLSARPVVAAAGPTAARREGVRRPEPVVMGPAGRDRGRGLGPDARTSSRHER